MLDPDARGLARIACVDARMNFAEPFVDPCAQSPCGSRGECVSLNGTATCRCDVGLVAVARIQRSVESVVIGALPRCLEPKVPLPDDFLAGLVPFEPNLPYPGRPGPMDPPADVNPGSDGGASTLPPRRGTPTADTGDSECNTASTHGAAPLGGLVVVLGLALARRRRFA